MLRDLTQQSTTSFTHGRTKAADSHHTLQTTALDCMTGYYATFLRTMPMCHAPSLRRPRRYPRRLSQLPGRLPSPSPFQLPALLRTASGQRANVLPQSDLASALPHELQRIMPPPPSRRRAVALLADQLLGLAICPVLLATGPPCLSAAAQQLPRPRPGPPPSQLIKRTPSHTVVPR